jgi:hypothetical protein
VRTVIAHYTNAMTDPIRNNEATTQRSSQPTRIPRTSHPTTGPSTPPIRPKIKNFTAHLGITIRRGKNQDKTGTGPDGQGGPVVDLVRTV